jgi:hypothetical protein
VTWERLGNLVVWDKRVCYMRLWAARFGGRYERGLKRTTKYAGGEEVWGLNEVGIG